MKKYFVLGLLLFLIHGNIIAAEKYCKTFETGRVTIKETNSNPRISSGILARQISQRCDAKLQSGKN